MTLEDFRDVQSALHQCASVIFSVTIQAAESAFRLYTATNARTIWDLFATVRADVLVIQLKEVFLLGFIHSVRTQQLLREIGVA
jgi:hypothetical protein